MTNIRTQLVVIMSLALLMLLLCSSTSTLAVAGELKCGTVVAELAPCLSFLKNGEKEQPSFGCCNGAKQLKGEAKTIQDRQFVCDCVKKALASFAGNYDPNRMPLIPQKCGFSYDLPPIGPNFDCST